MLIIQQLEYSEYTESYISNAEGLYIESDMPFTVEVEALSSTSSILTNTTVDIGDNYVFFSHSVDYAGSIFSIKITDNNTISLPFGKDITYYV